MIRNRRRLFAFLAPVALGAVVAVTATGHGHDATAAKVFRAKTIYIEVYDRIDLPTVTGRLCYPLSNLFLLQWEQQRRFYPKGEVIGRLL